MIHVGEALERLGTVWPRYDARHTPEWMVTSVRTTGFYPTPPTSGNAWTRRFLEAVFPLPVRAAGERRRWGLFFDDYLHMIAPWLGDVVSLAEPLSMYRLHGKMLSHFGGERPIGYIAEVCEEETDRMRAVNDFLAQRGIPFRYDFERYDDHLRGRLIYSRVLPERYPYADGKLALFVKYARAILRTERRPAKKLARIGWAAVTAFAPAPLGVKVGLLAA
jgi:hypothetical protein